MATNTRGLAPGGWRVASVVPATVAMPNGQLVRGSNVSYETASGATGKVFIPDPTLTPARAKPIVAAAAAATEGVATLSTPGGR